MQQEFSKHCVQASWIGYRLQGLLLNNSNQRIQHTQIIIIDLT